MISGLERYKKVDKLFPYATLDEALEGLRLRREFIVKNNPKHIIRRLAQIEDELNHANN